MPASAAVVVGAADLARDDCWYLSEEGRAGSCKGERMETETGCSRSSAEEAEDERGQVIEEDSIWTKLV